jgi:signal transduction histidine kinase
MFLSVLISIISAGIVLAGLMALLRGPKRAQNRWFFIFTIFLAVWIVSNFLDSNFVNSTTDILLKIDFSSILFTAWALLQFTLVFLIRNADKKRLIHTPTFTITSFLLNVMFSLLIFLNLVVTGDISTGKLIVDYMSLSWAYIFVFLAYFVIVFIILTLKSRRSKGLEKSAVKIIYIGLLIALLTNIFTNLIFPELFSVRSTVKELNIIGYGGLLFMTLMIYIAITTQKLFDIRIVIARSVGYVLSFAVIVVIYVTPTILISTHLLNYRLSVAKILYLVAVTCIVAILFQPLRSFFNKLTNKVFYRNYYEIQDVIDKLGNLLVGSVDPEEIKHKTLELLTGVLKPSYAKYLLLVNAREGDEQIIHGLSMTNKELIDTDELSSSASRHLYEAMVSNNIALALRLRTKHDVLGYIIFGYQKSGSSYSDVDKRLLSIAAAEIAISLQNALRFEEIQRFNVTLQAKVDEATKELKKTNEKLRAIDETKDDFISLASHQLRTPLSIIKGYVNMVIHGDAGKINEQQKDFLELAMLSSENMVSLVTELLNISRITSGKFSLDVGPVNLADVVDAEVKKLANMADSRKVALTFHKPHDFPTLLLDEEKIRQVIANFIDNAIYYSKHKNAKIDVQLTSEDDDIVFKVIDNGIGVPLQERDHLFTKFYRAKNAKFVRPNGTGVGLYLAKVVINEEGGNLIFESKEGEGSTFGFKFNKNKIIQNTNKAQ